MKDKIKSIEINFGTCYETYPCIHPVKVFLKDESSYETEWNGGYIHEMLKYLGEDIPTHFKEYNEAFVKEMHDDFYNRRKKSNSPSYYDSFMSFFGFKNI